MRNNFKKFAALALVLVMLVSTFVPAFATTDSCPGAGKTHTADNCTYTVIGTKEATCTESGFETARCTTCNAQFTAATLAPTGHDWAEAAGDCTTGVTKTCNNCGLKEVVTSADGHKWTPWVLNTEACEIGAQAQRQCTVCALKQSKVMTEAHNWELVEYTVPVKCVSAGEASYKCATKDCTATKTEKILYSSAVDATGDSMHAEWQYIGYNYTFTGLDADGNAKVYDVSKKQTSDVILRTGVVITKELFNSYLDKFVAPGTGVCLTGAVEPKFCLDCGTWAMDGIAAIPANAFGLDHGHWAAKHNFGNADAIVRGVLNPALLPKSGATYHAAVAPTCTTAGTVEYWECAYGCGTYLYNTTTYVEDPQAADGQATVKVESNEAKYFAVTQKLSDLAIAPTHWNYYTVAEAATCTNIGKSAHYCILCGDANILAYEIIPAKGHTFFCNYTEEKQAELIAKYTAEAALEYLTGKAAYADKTDLELVDLFLDYIDVKMGKTDTDATCTAAGKTTWSCLVAGCDATPRGTFVVETTPAQGHVENDEPAAESVLPTCTSNGVLIYKCKYCGTPMRSEKVDALGHTMTGVVVVKGATCAEEGAYINVCAVADCAYAARTEAAEGYVALGGKYVHRDLSENLVAIPKAHTWVEAVKSGNTYVAGNAISINCGTPADQRVIDRFCTTCKIFELGVVYEAPAHTHLDFNTSKALGLTVQAVIGTCDVQGIYYINCAVCGGAPVKYVDPYTGNGHNYLVLFEGKAATCKSEPNKAWTETSICLVCNKLNLIKFLPNNHINPETGVSYGFTDIQMHKNGLDLYFYNAHTRQLTTKYNSVTEVPAAQQEMIVALKKGAKIVDGMPANAEDIVKEVALSENVVWTFYVPGNCTTKGYFGGQLCKLCNNADCVTGVSAFAPKSGGNNEQWCFNNCATASHTTEGKHVRELVYTETAKCDQYGYKRYACKFCDDSIQLAYTEPNHTFGVTEDDTRLEANCELDGYYTQTCVDCGLTKSVVIPAEGHINAAKKAIVNSCIDRTGDRYCVRCASIIPMDHKFGDWTEADGVKTRTCADCAYVEIVELETETEPVETEPVETEPVVTEPEETKPVETAPVETKPVETEPVTEPATEKGCGSSIAAVAVALVAALGTCVVFAGKKRD